MPPDETTNIFSVIKSVISDPLFKQIASRIINKVIDLFFRVFCSFLRDRDFLSDKGYRRGKGAK